MTTAKSKRALRDEISSIFFLAMTLGFGFTLSAEVAEYVKQGLGLAVKYVIPTSFPFMIVSDMYVCYGRPENIRIIKAYSAHFSALVRTVSLHSFAET